MKTNNSVKRISSISIRAFAPAGVAWLNWITKGDRKAAGFFKEDPCKLAGDPKWIEIKKKNIY